MGLRGSQSIRMLCIPAPVMFNIVEISLEAEGCCFRQLRSPLRKPQMLTLLVVQVPCSDTTPSNVLKEQQGPRRCHLSEKLGTHSPSRISQVSSLLVLFYFSFMRTNKTNDQMTYLRPKEGPGPVEHG